MAWRGQAEEDAGFRSPQHRTAGNEAREATRARGGGRAGGGARAEGAAARAQSTSLFVPVTGAEAPPARPAGPPARPGECAPSQSVSRALGVPCQTAEEPRLGAPVRPRAPHARSEPPEPGRRRRHELREAGPREPPASRAARSLKGPAPSPAARLRPRRTFLPPSLGTGAAHAGRAPAAGRS